MWKIVELTSVWGTVLALAGFTIGGLIGMFDPIASASKFGMPINDDAGALYFRVYRSRDFVLLVIALIFLVRRDWVSLATLMTVSAALPAFDAIILYRQLGADAAVVPHIAAIGLFALLSVILWLRAIA